MGAVTFSLDPRLVECLKKALPLTTFVETGTYKGDAVAAVAPHFEKLVTVEFSEPLWKEARARFAKRKNIDVRLGNSKDALPAIVAGLGAAPTLFWLDAHWCVAENTAGDRSQCPLLQEIDAIGRLGAQSVILIDDARLFMAPPPMPHDADQWPSFDALLKALRGAGERHEIMVINDVIAFFPPLASGAMHAFAREHGVDWLRAVQSLEENAPLRAAIEQKEAFIHQQHDSLVEKEAMLQGLLKEASESQSRHLVLGNAQQEAEAAIQSLRTAFEASRAHREALDKALEEKEAVIQGLHRAVEQSRGHRRAIDTALEEKEAVIQGLHQAMGQARVHRLALDAVLADKEAVILSLRGHAVEQSRVHREALDAALAQKEAIIVALRNEAIEETRAHRQAMDTALADKEAVIQALREAAEQSRAHRQALEGALADKELVIQAMRDAADQARRQDEASQVSAATGSPEMRLLMMKGLEEKEAVIRELSRALEAYRSAFSLRGLVMRPLHRILSWAAARLSFRRGTPFTPRLGNLNQHPPRQLRLPGQYSRTVALSQPPRISLVTPSFQQSAFIERTLRSVLDQAYPNLEYHVQDGGSEDGTREILERYTDRLGSWESKPDSGQTNAINVGFARTSGEIMGWLNSDDMLLPGALGYVADFFSRHPDIDVVYGHRILIDENDREIGRWILPAHNHDVLSWADFVPQETLFWRRRIWESVGAHVDESFRFAMDWDLLVRFRDAGARFARLPRFLGAFRIHPHQKTSAAISDIGFREMDRIRQRALGRVPTGTEVRKALFPYLLKHVFADLGWRIRAKLRLRP